MEEQAWKPTELQATRAQLLVLNGLVRVAHKLKVSFLDILAAASHSSHWGEPSECDARGGWRFEMWSEKVLHEICHQVVACRGFKPKKGGESYNGDMDELHTLAMGLLVDERLGLGHNPADLLFEALDSLRHTHSYDNVELMVAAFQKNDWTAKTALLLTERILHACTEKEHADVSAIKTFVVQKCMEHYSSS